jgi:S-adenosylmethionine:diacylglycerol 3-amino-3-carboxypropyl transferase
MTAALTPALATSAPPVPLPSVGSGLWQPRFTSKLFYTSCNEDLDAELLGLALQPCDHVVAIAGGGGRALGLLLGDPASVVAVDYNLHQCRLLDLKQEAITHLDGDAFRAFMGLSGDAALRRKIWSGLAPHLSPLLRTYWGEHRRIWEGRLLYAGRMERFFRDCARVLGWLMGAELTALFAAETVAEQSARWERVATRRLWRALLKLAAHPLLLRSLSGNFGLYRFVPPGLRLDQFLDDRLRRYCGRHLFRSSHMLQLILLGRYLDDAGPAGSRPAWPHYLRDEHFATLKARVGRLETVHADVGRFLTGSAARFSKLSLSNLPAYMSEAEYSALWQVLLDRCAGGRLIFRHILFKRALPEDAHLRTTRDSALEAQLNALDKSLFYDFDVLDLH